MNSELLTSMERRMDEMEAFLGIGPDTPADYSLDVTDMQLKIREVAPLVAKMPMEQMKTLLAILEKPQLTDDEMLAEIESYMPLLQRWSEQLELVDRLKSALDSEAIIKLPTLKPRIEAAKKEMVATAQLVEKHSAEVEDLRALFEGVLGGINSQLVQWETILDRYEEAKASKN